MCVLAELSLSGAPAGRFAAGLADVPAGAFRIRNDAENALLVDGQKEGVLVRLDGVLLSGHFFHAMSGAAGNVGITLEASRSIFSGVTFGAGLGGIAGPTLAACDSKES